MSGSWRSAGTSLRTDRCLIRLPGRNLLRHHHNCKWSGVREFPSRTVRRCLWKLLQENNATPHLYQIVRQFQQESGIRRIVWPASTADLNAIEHLWDEPGRRVTTRSKNNCSILATALKEEWEAITQEFIRNPFHSMPWRIWQVITDSLWTHRLLLIFSNKLYYYFWKSFFLFLNTDEDTTKGFPLKSISRLHVCEVCSNRTCSGNERRKWAFGF